MSNNKHLSDHFNILDLGFAQHLLNVPSQVIVSECSEIQYRLNDIFRERMNSIQKHILGDSASSIRTLDEHILFELDIYASQFIRIAGSKEDHVLWETLSKELPISEDIANETEVFSGVKLIKQNP